MTAIRAASCSRLTLLAALVSLGGASCTRGALLRSDPVTANQTDPVQGVGYYLPKTLVRVDLYVDSGLRRRPIVAADGTKSIETKLECGYFGVFAAPRVVPDLRHHFVINPQYDMSASDELDVGVSPEGLLTHVCGTAKDESHDIATNLAGLVSLLVTAPIRMNDGAGRGDLGDLKANDIPLPPRLVSSLEFDPMDASDLARVREELSRHAVKLSIVRQSDCPVATSGSGCCTTCTSTQPGVYYRLPVPYRMQLNPGGRVRSVPLPPGSPVPEGLVVEGLEGPLDQTYLLPNEAICKFVPVTRAAFVTKKTALTFDHGMLTQATTNKPSELLAFVKIPVDVATTILGIPSELLKIRIEQNNRQQELIQSQTSVANSEAAQLQALDTLLRLKQSQPAPQPAASAPGGP